MRTKKFSLLTYKKAANIAIIIAGSKFATRTFLPKTKLTPTQKISIEPIKDRLFRAVAVINGRTKVAIKVSVPSKRKTGMAENIQPLPKDEAITITKMKSRIVFVPKIDQSP